MNQPSTNRVFQAADAKLKRAFENLKLLHTGRIEFRKRCPDPLTVEFDASTEWWVARMNVREEPPPDLGVLVGDIAYQCLSAFNHLVWELAARKKGRRKVHGRALKWDIQVPIAASDHRFERSGLVKRKLVSKKAIAVLEGLQPYVEGHGPSGPNEHPLPLIKEIADSDKHREITGTLAGVELSLVSFTWDSTAASGPEKEILVPPGVQITGNEPIVRIRFKAGNEEANMKVKDQPELDLLFQTDNWTVPFGQIETSLRWAYDRLWRFAPLFPAA